MSKEISDETGDIDFINAKDIRRTQAAIWWAVGLAGCLCFWSALGKLLNRRSRAPRVTENHH